MTNSLFTACKMKLVSTAKLFISLDVKSISYLNLQIERTKTRSLKIKMFRKSHLRHFFLHLLCYFNYLRDEK